MRPALALVALSVLAASSTALAQETKEAKWYDRVKLAAFVDAYASFNPRNPKVGAVAGVHRFRAYDQHNGFSMHWVGFDAFVDPEPVGGGVSLRFGPSVAIYTGSPDSELGLANVKQAFVTWKPAGAASKLKLWLGKFDTIYGAEVADSQLNVTYTRSMLNFYAQPFFHTGLRADYQVADNFELRALAVNGWNNAVDNNLGKTFGLQANYLLAEKVLFALGYLLGPEQADSVRVSCADGQAYNARTFGCIDAPGATASDTVVRRGSNNSRLRHIVDLVIDANPTDALRILFNFDWATEELRDLGAAESQRKVWWGADVTVRQKLGKLAFVGVRGSYFRDRHGYLTGTATDTAVTSGTVTLGYTPTANLMIKLEPRLDVADDAYFLRGVDGTSRTQLTTTLGVVATTN